MKKGFTLVELMAVITLLGLIILIAYPTILNQIEKKQQQVDSAKQKLIEAGADVYLSEHQNEYPYRIGNQYCLSLDTIVNENHIAIDVSDLSLRGIKVLMGSNHQYTYTLVEKCN